MPETLKRFRERPILMSALMVRAILEDRKSQTRRIMRVQPPNETYTQIGTLVSSTAREDRSKEGQHHWIKPDSDMKQPYFRCPYGYNGDRLWVKETWMPRPGLETISRPHYRADKDRPEWKGLWKSSMFMPRWASRITLEVTDVRMERLQDISAADSVAEGLIQLPATRRYVISKGNQYFGGASGNPVEVYSWLWESINGAGSWDKNPYVWCVSFRRI